jgi:FeS assembly SUF system protein
MFPPDYPAAAPTSTNDVDALVPDAARTGELKPQIVDAISTVYDPEIPVNIWELGLIYDVIVDAGGVAGIRMTLTAPGCPAAQSLPVEVMQKVKAVPGVTDAKVDIVWEPAWSKDRMSDAAKLQLGLW